MMLYYRYSGGGIITGALFKLKSGPKPAIAGAVMGGALGTIAGCVNLALMALTGENMTVLPSLPF